MTAREVMSVDEALFYADAWGAQEDSLGHSDLAFKALAAEVRRLRSLAQWASNLDLCRVYYSAYHAGHHDTVEGVYTDVLHVDRDTYWREAVDELRQEGSVSPSPTVFDMDSAVEAFYAEIKRRYPDAYVEPDADTKADVSAGIAEAVNAAQPDMEALRRENVELVEILKRARRELDACQSVIHLAGGFDPAYVTGAKAVIKEIDAARAAQAGKQGGG